MEMTETVDKVKQPVMEEKLLPGMRRRGIVEAHVMEKWWRNLASEPPGTAEALWNGIAFEVWAQRFLDAPRTAQTTLVGAA